MLKMVQVMAGMDAQYERHLEGVKAVFKSAFSFHPGYLEKIQAYAHGQYPPGSECIILAAIGAREVVVVFTVAFYFADLKMAYLDYIASDPKKSSRSEEHTSELQSHHELVFRLLLETQKRNDTE